MVYKYRQNLYLLFNNVNEMDIFLLLLTAVLGLVIIQRIYKRSNARQEYPLHRGSKSRRSLARTSLRGMVTKG